MEASKATEEKSVETKGGAANAASPKGGGNVKSQLRTTAEMIVGSATKVDDTDWKKYNPNWQSGRLKHIKRRTTDHMLTAFSAQLKPPHNPKWKKGRLDHITRTLTIPVEAPPKWVITDKSFEHAGLKLVAWKWTKLTAIEYSTADMFAGGAFGMLTSDVDPTAKKSAVAKG